MIVCGMTVEEIMEMRDWFDAIKPLTGTDEFKIVLARARRQKALADAKAANARAREADAEVMRLLSRRTDDVGETK